jgi:ComEC/Rec2-related protein
VRNAVLWIVALAAIIEAYALACRIDPSQAAIALAICTAVTLLAGVSALILRGDRWPITALAVVALALARGFGSGDRAAVDAWPAGARGVATGVHTFVIEGASWPGASCQVLAHELGARRSIALELPIAMCPLGEGATVHVLATGLEQRGGAQWPGGMDPHQMARARGASWAAGATAAWPGTPGEPGYWSLIAAIRQRLWRTGLVSESRAFVVGSLFGIRSALPPDRRHELATAGLGHLVAVSGMQVSLIAWLLHRVWLRVLAPVVGSIGLAFALASLPMLAYVGLVGAEAPAVRAAIMVLAAGVAAAIGRPGHGLTVLAWTSVAMLAVRPAWAFDVGFQLSVAAMAAIVRGPADGGLLLQSWRVCWAISPVLALHFDETGAWSVPANLIAVPVFSSWVTPLGIAGACTAPLLGDAAWIPAQWGAQLVLDLAGGFARLPRVSFAVVAVVAALVLPLRRWGPLARRPWFRRWSPSTLVCAAVLLVFARTSTAPEGPARSASWFAFGPRRTPTVIARQPDGRACVREPGGTAAMWPGLLRALAIDEVGAIEGDADAPHVVALRDELRATGRWRPLDDCELPAPAAVSSAMQACRRITGGRASFVAGTAGSIDCFVDGRWLPREDIH